MARTRRKALSFDLDVDERTSEMSDQALYCRSRGHKWEDRGITRKRYAELLADGLMEDNMYCDSGCGSTWIVTWSLRTGEVLESKRDYAKGGDYRMPPGQGRLPRGRARIARAARLIPAYA